MILIVVLMQTIMLLIIGTILGLAVWYVRSMYGLFASGRRGLPFELSTQRTDSVRPFKFLGMYGNSAMNNVGAFLKVSTIQAFALVVVWTIWPSSQWGLIGALMFFTYLRMSDRMDVATVNYEKMKERGGLAISNE